MDVNKTFNLPVDPSTLQSLKVLASEWRQQQSAAKARAIWRWTQSVAIAGASITDIVANALLAADKLGVGTGEAPVATPVATPVTKETPLTETAPANAIEAALDVIRKAVSEPVDPAKLQKLVEAEVEKAVTKVVVRPVEIRIPDRAPVEIDTPHPMLDVALKWAAIGKHLFLVGPAGTGKTTLAEQVAVALGRDFGCAEALDSKYSLLGYRNPEGGYVSTVFRDRFENGGLMLLDEIDSSHDSVPQTINMSLANQRQAFPDGIVNRHKDFLCVCAGNTWGRGADRMYVGTTQLNAAFLDRFAFLEVDYPGVEFETKLSRGNTKWVERVRKLRAAVINTRSKLVVSMRASIDGAKALDVGISQFDVENALIWKGIDTDTRNRIEAEARNI